MDPGIIAAIISLIGVVLSLIVSILFNIFQTKYNYNQLFAQTVSENRMDWINVWRENVSKFLSCAEVLVSIYDNCDGENIDTFKESKIIEYKKEFYESRTMITSRLNLEENLHILMLSAINQIDYKDSQNFAAKRDLVLEIARKILKPEWERVKDEARGKRKR